MTRRGRLMALVLLIAGAVIPASIHAQENLVTIIPMELNRAGTSNNDGWDGIELKMGFKNNTGTDVYVAQIDPSMVMEVEENHQYDLNLQWWIPGEGSRAYGDLFYEDRVGEFGGALYGMVLPNNFALCDVFLGYSEEPVNLTGYGRIPSTTTLIDVAGSNFETAYVEDGVSPEECFTDVTNEQELGSYYFMTDEGGEQPEITMEVGEGSEWDVVRITVDNSVAKFQDATISGAYLWAAYEDGTWAAPVRRDPLHADSECYLTGPFDLKVGPAQKKTFELCLPNEVVDKKMVALELNVVKNLQVAIGKPPVP